MASVISAADLAPNREKIRTLTDATSQVALCKEIFNSWKEKLDGQLTTKKRKLAADLLHMQHELTNISDRYNDLATTSEQLASDGVKLADEMVDVTDYILNGAGEEHELRQRLQAATRTGDELSVNARTLQIRFTMLNEGLHGLRQSIEDTKLNVQKEKKNRTWRKKFLGIALTLLKALAIAMTVVGVVMTAVSAAPAGIVIGAGLLTVAVVTGTVAESMDQLISLFQDEKSTQESRLDQVITVIRTMESEMTTVTRHIAELENFYNDQSSNLHRLTIQDKRISFTGSPLEAEKLKATKRDWQEVKEGFEAINGQAHSWKRSSGHSNSNSKLSISS